LIGLSTRLAVADAAFLESGGGPPEDNVAVGDRIEVRPPATGETAARRVVAVSAAGAAFSGVMVSKESLAGFVENPVENRHYLGLAEGAEPGAVAARLQREFLASGLEARSFEQVVREALRSQEQFFDLIEGYLALGLVIGVAGLGVVMSRAARERRYQIGVLRALGFSPPAVRAAFLVEAGLIALEGTLVGTALALATSYQLIVNAAAFGDTGTAFAVPWAELALLLAFILVASVLFALPAAVRAARMPPAATLRTAEESA
jgi:putative ABC transport system permease protein